MASYKIAWRKSTKKDLRKLPKPEIVKIIRAVEPLAETPLATGAEKLTGSEHTFRIRVGDYRIIYEVLSSAEMIEIQRVRHRRDVYRR